MLIYSVDNRLSVTKDSSSFKRLDTHTPTYTTFTFIIKAPCLVTYHVCAAVLNEC